MYLVRDVFVAPRDVTCGSQTQVFPLNTIGSILIKNKPKKCVSLAPLSPSLSPPSCRLLFYRPVVVVNST